MKQEWREIFKKVKASVEIESSLLIQCLNNIQLIFQSFYFHQKFKRES